MTFKVKDAGGTLQTIASMKVLDGGTLRTLRTVKVMDADGVTLRTVAVFATPLTGVQALPLIVEATGAGSLVTSSIAMAVPTGGLSPFTYSWVRLTGTASANSPAAAVTTFTSAALSPGQSSTSTFRVTVTDSIGADETTDISVILGRFP
jgi:hypothetical protein